MQVFSFLDTLSEFNKLLDQIFDEFGLIVCGWSAEWDYALRDAIYRCQSRRFATYWATRGVPGEEAERLIGHRKAETITIASADAFFQTLRDYVEAVEEFSRPHPLSTEATIAILKRYMSESRYRIQHSDLIHDAVRKALEETSTDGYDVNRHQPNGESFSTRVRGYDVACSTFLAMAPVAGFWAEPEHYPVWERALSRLANVEQRGGYTVWLSLERYPALLLLFALGIGVLEARRIELLSQLFFVPTHEPNEGNLPAGVVLPRHCLSGDTVTLARALPGVGNIRFPFSKWIYTVVREHTRNIIPSEKQYAFVFAKFELLLALGFGHHEDKRFGYWAPPGTFVYLYEERRRAVNEIQESLTRQNDKSPYVQCGIFGDTAESCRQEIDNLMAFLPKLGSF